METMEDSELLMVPHLDPQLKCDTRFTGSKMLHLETDTSDIRNMFELQEFMDRHHTSEGKTTLAALKMIDLQTLDNDFDDSPTVKLPATFLIEYNPHEKQKRLGRPRKHLKGRTMPVPDSSSTENLEKLTLSMFRLDERPLEGPGSRGGDPTQLRKRKGQVTESSGLKKRKQALLNFNRSGDSAQLGLRDGAMDNETEEKENNDEKDSESNGKQDTAEESDKATEDGQQNRDQGTGNDGNGEDDGNDRNGHGEENDEANGDGQGNDANGDDNNGDNNNGDDKNRDNKNEKDKDDKDMSDNEKEESDELKKNGTTEDTEPEAGKVGTEVEIKQEPEKSTPSGRARTAARKKVMEEMKAKKEEALRLEQEQQKREKKPKRSTPKETKVKKLTLNFKQPASPTTIIRDKNRVTRTNPGPLIPIHFDLYDENLMFADINKQTAAEKLALGFPVHPCPYLYDIIYIISYLTKFRHIVDVGPVGPDDIEIGLGLVHEEYPKVSPLMELLFRRLLALVLNRKKPILLSMQRSAIQELRSQYINLGLPEEWRDDTMARVVTNLPCEPDLDHVDPSKPKATQSENYEYLAPLEKMNPFHEQDFYEYGLQGILNAIDRLVVIRCLMVWSLSASNIVKAHLVNVINNQDIPGEKDTHYGSRAVLKGFAQTADLKREIELKKAKKKSLSKSSTPTPESKTIDPTSDPTKHPMSLRLNEFLVGDCGFHIGRFYLVRMADSSAGGLGSLEKMRNVVNDVAGVRSAIPSTFKLYVEDVHAVLKESLRVEGVEFDSQGNEVPSPTSYDDGKHWHVVASNTEELSRFLDHVGKRLGLVPGEENILSLGSLSHKPLLHMYRYLSHLYPLLDEYEKLNINGASELRSSRKKKVNYSVAQEPTEEEEQPEYVVEDGDDDDYDDGHEDYLEEEYS